MSSPPDLPTHADVVIIGSGIQGLCCAYGLIKQGINSVVIVEALGHLGGRSTGRSAAMLTRLTGHELTTVLANRSIAMYRELGPELEDHTGIDIDFTWCGFAIVGLEEEAITAVQSEYAEHQAVGVDSQLGTGLLLRQLTDGFFNYPNDATVCLCPEDGFVNIYALTLALSTALRTAGVVLAPHRQATGIVVDDDTVVGVDVGGERVAAGIVVNAAGILAGRVAAWVGKEIQIQPSKKNLIGVPNLSGRFRGPIVECLDDGWYFRPNGTGLLVGVGKGHNVDLDVAAADEPQLDPWVVEECKAYLRRWTSIPEKVIASIAPDDGWAGYRPIHAKDSEAVGRAPAHLPLFGDGQAARGYFESCGWGEFGVTLGPIGGFSVAQDILKELGS